MKSTYEQLAKIIRDVETLDPKEDSYKEALISEFCYFFVRTDQNFILDDFKKACYHA